MYLQKVCMQFSATQGSFLWIQADLKVEIRAQLSAGSRGAVGGPALRCAPAASTSLPRCSDLLSLCVPPCLVSKAAATIKIRTSGHKTISKNNLSALDRLIEGGSAHRIAAAAALTSAWLIKSQKSHCCLNCV